MAIHTIYHNIRNSNSLPIHFSWYFVVPIILRYQSQSQTINTEVSHHKVVGFLSHGEVLLTSFDQNFIFIQVESIEIVFNPFFLQLLALKN